MSSYQDIDGEKLRVARQVKMLSQGDLAKLTGIPQSMLSTLERGHRKAQPRTVRRLAEALGVDPLELVRT
jgi:transcriptional regulator with XRE-family HTH domain